MPAPPHGPHASEDHFLQGNHPSSPQIAKWVRHQVLGQSTKAHDCTQIVVRHLTINKRPNGDVGLFKIDYDSIDAGGIDHLIDEICNSAQQDANALRQGIQNYGVYAYFDSNPDYAPRTFLRIAAEDAYDPDADEGSPSEPPNNTGITSQLMRHLEATMRTSTVHTHTLIETLMRDNQSQRALIEKMMGQSIDFAAIMQESLDNSTARRIAEKDAALKSETIGTAFEHLKLLFPVILNKIAGQKIAPETDQSFTLLAAFFESLSAEQQQKLITEFCSPSQAAVLAEFIDTYEKRKRTLTTADNKAPGPKLNLGAMFDPTSERLAKADSAVSGDQQLTRMEKRAVSFKEAFTKPMPQLGLAIRPADKPEHK
jgi:hypothetical protein